MGVMISGVTWITISIWIMVIKVRCRIVGSGQNLHGAWMRGIFMEMKCETGAAT